MFEAGGGAAGEAIDIVLTLKDTFDNFQDYRVTPFDALSFEYALGPTDTSVPEYTRVACGCDGACDRSAGATACALPNHIPTFGFSIAVRPTIAGLYNIKILLQDYAVWDWELTEEAAFKTVNVRDATYSPENFLEFWVFPSEVDVTKASVYQDGLEEGQVGVPANFLVAISDRYDNRFLAYPGFTPVGWMNATDPAVESVPIQFVWDTDADAFLASYVPVRSGEYTANIELDGVTIPLSQQGYSATLVRAGPVDTSQSYALGAGVGEAGDIPVGSPVQFTVVTRDAEGNDLSEGGLLFFVYVRSQDGAAIVRVSDVVDNEDGTYTATYTPLFTGPANVEVARDGAFIRGLETAPECGAANGLDACAPIPVTFTSGLTSAEESVAFGPGLCNVSVGEETTFEIQVRQSAVCASVGLRAHLEESFAFRSWSTAQPADCAAVSLICDKIRFVWKPFCGQPEAGNANRIREATFLFDSNLYCILYCMFTMYNRHRRA